jgi:hypothetical protein
MVEGGQGAGLAPEGVETLGVRGHLGGKDFGGDLAAELRVGGPVHLAHAVFADGGDDAVVGDHLSNHRVTPGSPSIIRMFDRKRLNDTTRLRPSGETPKDSGISSGVP